MGGVLSSAIQDSVYSWLDRLESLAREADEPSRAALASGEMARLVAAWRALLSEHQPDEDGRCRRCARSRRRRAQSCTVWSSANRYLLGDDTDALAVGRHKKTVTAANRRGRHGS